MDAKNDSTFIEKAKVQSLFVRSMYYRDCHQWQRVLDTYHPEPSKTLIQLSWLVFPFQTLSAGRLHADLEKKVQTKWRTEQQQHGPAKLQERNLLPPSLPGDP